MLHTLRLWFHNNNDCDFQLFNEKRFNFSIKKLIGSVVIIYIYDIML